LERPAALLEKLVSPHEQYRSILIAGTKGKGSTAALLESILRAAGLKTGLYTSPHLHTYRERLRVNGQAISRGDFAVGVGHLRPILHELTRTYPAPDSFTTFEVMTVLALLHFARERVEVAILEVGLGGRLDATNVVDTDLALITSISFDHTQVLGSTLPKIAREKAGIIKLGKPVLSAQQQPEVTQVLERVARDRNAPIGISGRDWFWQGVSDNFLVAAPERAGLWKEPWRHHDLRVALRGMHQLENAALAVAASEIISGHWSMAVPEQAIRSGLDNVKWMGRIEVLQERDANNPFIVADGAHNGDSSEKLVAALKFHFAFERLWLILGALRDKDLHAIVKPFLPLTAFAWTVQTQHARAADAEKLAQQLNQSGIPARAVPGFAQALEHARASALPNDLICITGSLSIVAQARQALGFVNELDADSS
jgi:dihydrofolate synthase / folylpolyglutamate synthase